MSRRLARLVLALLALLASTACEGAPSATPAGSASATVASAPGTPTTTAPRSSGSPAGRQWYLSLGTSIAAGQQPDRGDDPRSSYAGLLSDRLRRADPQLLFEPLGCSGETLRSLVRGGLCAYREGSQLRQALAFLRAHRGQVGLITIDIGANDLWPCARGGAAERQSCVDRVLPTLRSGLARVLRLLSAAAPQAQVVGMTYYDPFLASWLLGGDQRSFALDTARLVTSVNAGLSATYRSAGAGVADVAGAFATGDTSLVDTGRGRLPRDVAEICRLTWMCRSFDVHPTDAGHRVIAAAFAAALPR